MKSSAEDRPVSTSLRTDFRPREDAVEYRELLRSARLSVGVYTLPKGAADPQQPHTEDEVYHIVRGAGFLRIGETDHPAVTGNVLYVPAGVPHRFHSIQEPIVALVVFAPPEGSLSAGGRAAPTTAQP